MTIKRTKKSFFDVSSVLCDLAFLLIIYFIVIAGFNINNGFLISLPAKESTKILPKEDILRYELNESGDILFMGQPTSIAEAERGIASAVRTHPNLAVLLTISAQAPWQSVVSFIELAEKLSVDSFSFKIANEVLGAENGT